MSAGIVSAGMLFLCVNSKVLPLDQMLILIPGTANAPSDGLSAMPGTSPVD